jgi:hypothetical protein
MICPHFKEEAAVLLNGEEYRVVQAVERTGQQRLPRTRVRGKGLRMKKGLRSSESRQIQRSLQEFQSHCLE